MRVHSLSFVALLTAASISFAASGAEPSPSAKLEIEQLLGRLAESDCRFHRNGSWHDTAEARAHIEKKYRYLLERHLVRTTDDFIALAATKSSTSGKPYLVQCGNQAQVPSAQWMTAQLAKVRAAKPDARPKTR